MVTIIIIIIVFVAVGLLILVGLAAIAGASEEMYREMEDEEQLEYIRKWNAEKARKEAAKKHKRKRH